ncbi:MAG: hypothetical protein ABIF82_06235 [Planctomycetota bacterium]
MEIDPLILRCARLRVEGKQWREVAAALDRSVETVEAWPRKRREQWLPALRQAVDEALPEATREAWLVLRGQLRSKHPRDRLRAAEAIMRHVREVRGKFLKLAGADAGGLKIIIRPARDPADQADKGRG